jgi:putative tryptophan/tyrosine transport system substrate-binding protein
MPTIARIGFRVGMWIAALLLWSAAPPGMAGEAQAIIVLLSHDAEPYRQALAGVEKALRQRKPDIPVTAKQLAGDPNKAAEALQEAMRKHARAVVTLGSVATQVAIRTSPRAPVVAGLVPTATSLQGGSGPMTGVVLEFSAETQFRWLRRFLPNSRTVGVLYNPAENKGTIAAAASVAGRQGFALDAVAVEDPRQLPAALEAIGRRVDVLLGFPDQLVLTTETAKQILLLSFRNRIPVVGPSPGWVKAGALYALGWDYEDLGIQCGELVDRIMQDGSAANAAPAVPRKVLYVVNQRTAQHMNLDLPEALLRGASGLF